MGTPTSSPKAKPVTSKMVVAVLIDARKSLGWSHETLASATKLHRSTISLIESGKREPTLRTVLKMTQAMGLKLGTILRDLEL